MTSRKELMTVIAAFFPEGRFIQDGYRSKPTPPYGNYSRQDVVKIRADEETQFVKTTYIIRAVTNRKDYDLEQKLEQTFEDMKVYWDLFDEADEPTDRVHVVEYVVECVEPWQRKGQ